jgi:hypothetical protein
VWYTGDLWQFIATMSYSSGDRYPDHYPRRVAVVTAVAVDDDVLRTAAPDRGTQVAPLQSFLSVKPWLNRAHD